MIRFNSLKWLSLPNKYIYQLLCNTKYNKLKSLSKYCLNLNHWLVWLNCSFTVLWSDPKYSELKATARGKIPMNAYRLSLPSHIHTSDIFNVKHLVPFTWENDSGDEADSDSRENRFQDEENGGYENCMLAKLIPWSSTKWRCRHAGIGLQWAHHYHDP